MSFACELRYPEIWPRTRLFYRRTHWLVLRWSTLDQISAITHRSPSNTVRSRHQISAPSPPFFPVFAPIWVTFGHMHGYRHAPFKTIRMLSLHAVRCFLTISLRKRIGYFSIRGTFRDHSHIRLHYISNFGLVCVNRVVAVDLCRASRVFLRVLRFSSLPKINT